MGRSELLAQDALATPLLRLTNVAVMQRAMAEVMIERTTDDWLDLLARHDIPAARVNSLDDLVDDPHLRAVGFFEPIEHPTEGPILGMKAPVRFGAGHPIELPHAPLIGEQNEEVRRDLRHE